MPRGKQSKGRCAYCGAEMVKSGMTRHLDACLNRMQAVEQADRQPGPHENLYSLRVQDAYRADFWLDLEMNGSAKLDDLDSYLRAIWLECCGHLSRFSVGSGWGSREIAMRRRADEVFAYGTEYTHIYDFGTSSETQIKIVSVREGRPTTKHPVALMARNLMPEAECIECGQPAKWLCMECMIEDDVWGTLCDKHAKNHPHDNYGEPLLLVNSPRLGMCGYDGPAEPPY